MSEPRRPEVGDVFEESWGYDQTNVDFYVVTKVTKSGVRIAPCGKDVVNGRVVPAPERQGRFTRNRVGKPTTDGTVFKRLQLATWRSDDPYYYLSMTSYSVAELWDGEPMYDTLAAGHAGH